MSDCFIPHNTFFPTPFSPFPSFFFLLWYLLRSSASTSNRIVAEGKSRMLQVARLPHSRETSAGRHPDPDDRSEAVEEASSGGMDVDCSESSRGEDTFFTLSCVANPHFPIYIRTSDIVSLWSSRVGRHRSWLNETTIDAIVLFDERPSSRHRRTSPRLRGVYVGSSFDTNSLETASDEYTLNIRKLLNVYQFVLMIVNVGIGCALHWVLLKFEDGSCTLYDSMASTHVDSSLIYFAARVFGHEHGLGDLALSRRFVSVRTQLPTLQLPFFHLVNTEIQLTQQEGYNCGMYCGLWARSYILDKKSIHKYTLEEMDVERNFWERQLSFSPRFMCSLL
jgi:hypothetical protein